MGVGGVRCSSVALQTKAKESASETTVTTSIYLQPPMAKTLAVAVQWLGAVFLNQRQGVTSESESTCSHVPPGLRCDGQPCQPATGNTWADKQPPNLGSLSHSAPLWVVLSFPFGLGPITRVKVVELRRWVHLFL